MGAASSSRRHPQEFRPASFFPSPLPTACGMNYNKQSLHDREQLKKILESVPGGVSWSWKERKQT